MALFKFDFACLRKAPREFLGMAIVGKDVPLCEGVSRRKKLRDRVACDSGDVVNDDDAGGLVITRAIELTFEHFLNDMFSRRLVSARNCTARGFATTSRMAAERLRIGYIPGEQRAFPSSSKMYDSKLTPRTRAFLNTATLCH